MGYNLIIFEKINNIAGKSAILDNIGIFFAEYVVFILFAIVLFLWIRGETKRRFEIGSGILGAIFISVVFVPLIRNFYYHARPFIEMRVNQLIAHGPEASFPSGHTSILFALSTGVFLYNRKLGIWFYIISFLVGLSRIFVGVHWPADIVSGMALGIIITLLVFYFTNKLRHQNK